jgi:F-type H+-transporting ATPase subunit b
MIATQWRRSALALMARMAGAALVAQLAAGVAWAAEGAAAGGDPWRALLWKTVNFAVLIGLLWYFGRKPLHALLYGSARASRAEFDEHNDWARQAEDDLAEQRRRIDELQAELQRLLGEARDEARSEHERLLGEARGQAERIKAAVQVQMEQEFNKARKELQAELAGQTVRLAEQLITRRLDEPARKRLMSQAVEQLGART